MRLLPLTPVKRPRFGAGNPYDGDAALPRAVETAKIVLTI